MKVMKTSVNEARVFGGVIGQLTMAPTIVVDKIGCYVHALADDARCLLY